jgi:hypothetical protein
MQAFLPRCDETDQTVGGLGTKNGPDRAHRAMDPGL